MRRLKHWHLGKQVVWYTFVGVAQLLLDWLCFVALTAWGMPVAPANVLARVVAAMLGFTANGAVTFKSRLSTTVLIRFSTVWIPLTLANTVAVWALGAFGGLHVAWLLKPLIDGLTAVVSFVLARYWVFRARHHEHETQRDTSPNQES